MSRCKAALLTERRATPAPLPCAPQPATQPRVKPLTPAPRAPRDLAAKWGLQALDRHLHPRYGPEGQGFTMSQRWIVSGASTTGIVAAYLLAQQGNEVV